MVCVMVIKRARLAGETVLEPPYIRVPGQRRSAKLRGFAAVEERKRAVVPATQLLEIVRKVGRYGRDVGLKVSPTEAGGGSVVSVGADELSRVGGEKGGSIGGTGWWRLNHTTPIHCLRRSTREGHSLKSGRMEDWVFDSLLGFLRSPAWGYPVNSFIDRHCAG